MRGGKLALWRYDYNTVRPHSSLGNETPQQARRTLEQFEGPAEARSQAVIYDGDSPQGAYMLKGTISAAPDTERLTARLTEGSEGRIAWSQVWEGPFDLYLRAIEQKHLVTPAEEQVAREIHRHAKPPLQGASRGHQAAHDPDGHER